jgi:hypothetical protein
MPIPGNRGRKNSIEHGRSHVVEERLSFAKRWKAYRATKGQLVWAAIAGSVVTIVVGFAWGGWMLGGSAEEAKTTAVYEARMQLLAALCVDRFTGAQNATATLADLKKAGEWERRDMIRKGGWIAVNNVTEQSDSQAATLCADRLAAMEPEKTAN